MEPVLQIEIARANDTHQIADKIHPEERARTEQHNAPSAAFQRLQTAAAGEDGEGHSLDEPAHGDPADIEKRNGIIRTANVSAVA